jgi:hypothetical protein
LPCHLFVWWSTDGQLHELYPIRITPWWWGIPHALHRCTNLVRDD